MVGYLGHGIQKFTILHSHLHRSLQYHYRRTCKMMSLHSSYPSIFHMIEGNCLPTMVLIFQISMIIFRIATQILYSDIINPPSP